MKIKKYGKANYKHKIRKRQQIQKIKIKTTN